MKVAFKSERDRDRVEQIITGVMQNPGYLTVGTHQQFWQILDDSGATDEQIADLRVTLTGVATTYNELFYEDALEALRTGTPVKSSTREAYENQLLDSNQADPSIRAQFERNESLMTNIATRKPVVANGMTLVFDEELIFSALENIDDVTDRLDKLFVRPAE